MEKVQRTKSQAPLKKIIQEPIEFYDHYTRHITETNDLIIRDTIFKHLTRDTNGCWIWSAHCPKGRTSAQIRVDGVNFNVRKFMVRHFLAAGNIDRIYAYCRNSKPCMNPLHLAVAARGGRFLRHSWPIDACVWDMVKEGADDGEILSSLSINQADVVRIKNLSFRPNLPVNMNTTDTTGFLNRRKEEVASFKKRNEGRKGERRVPELFPVSRIQLRRIRLVDDEISRKRFL